MFGYITPMYSRMSASDVSLYRKYYCETCHQLKSEFGLFATSTVNYDMTFNTLLLDSLSNNKEKFEGTKKSPLCMFSKPKSNSELMKSMAAYTMLLVKWELVDDAVDKPSIRTNGLRLALNKAIMSAEKKYPEYDNIIGKGFEELRQLELSNCTDAIMIGKTFGKHLTFILDDISKNNSSDLTNLFVGISTSVYIMDALDDLDRDFMDGTYNPFLKGLDTYENKKAYISDNLYQITDIINNVLKDVQLSYSSIKNRINDTVGITDNIIYYGLPDSAKKVISGESEAKPSIKNILNGHKNRKVT